MNPLLKLQSVSVNFAGLKALANISFESYEGEVVKIMDFGAFVSVTPNQDGLVHISQISQERVNNVSDVLSEGDVVKVKVLEVDKQGRVKLTMKDIEN